MASSRTHQVGTPVVVEPDVSLDGMSDGHVSILERFRQAVTTKPDVPLYELTVPLRPELTMLFDVSSTDYDTFQVWARKCTDKKREEVNWWNLAVIVISNLNRGIKLEGDLVEVDGETWTIGHRNVHEFLGVPVGGTRQAIRQMYLKDGHAIQATKMIIDKMGYSVEGDVAEAEDGGPLDG